MRGSSSHHMSLWPKESIWGKVWIQRCLWTWSSLKLKWSTVILHWHNRWCIFLQLISYAVRRLQRVRGNPWCFSATISSPPGLSSIPPQTVAAGRLPVWQSPAESLPDLFQDFGIWQVTHSYSWEPCLGCCLMQVNLASQPGCEGRLTESQNGLDWNGPFKCHLIPNPLPCTRTPFTWSAYSVQCPAWPWMLPRTGHSLLMAPLQPGQCLIWSFTSGQGCCFLPSLLEIFWMWL